MNPLRLRARFVADPPPGDWREALAARLGQRPRRIGLWAELALYGARLCLDAGGTARLPVDASLRVASLGASTSATRLALEQCRTALPMPFTFLQSQPSQMLAALSLHLEWQGDARFMLSHDRDALLRLCQSECGAGGLLLGWVEEANGPDAAPSSEWWHWDRADL
jgi:hypothetical protein